MLKNLRLLRLLPMLSLACISACGPKGPIVTICDSNPKENNFICKNPNWKTSLNMSLTQVDGWIFLSAADEGSELTACINRTSAKVNVCVFSSQAMAFSCFNETNGLSSGLSFANSENMVGISSVDEQILLTYCESLK